MSEITFFLLPWLAWLVGVGSFLLLVLFIGHLLVALILVIPTWKICTRAGYSGAWSLLHFIPFVGSFIVMAILAFGDWPNGEAGPESR